MIDGILLQSGSFGLLAYLIWWQTQRIEKQNAELQTLISNNTKALIKNTLYLEDRIEEKVELKFKQKFNKN